MTRKIRDAHIRRKAAVIDELDDLYELFATHGGRISRSLGPRTVLGAEQEAILSESAVRLMRILTGRKNVRACVLRVSGNRFVRGGYYPESSHPRTEMSVLNDPTSSCSLAATSKSIVVVEDVAVELKRPKPRFLADPGQPHPEGSHVSFPMLHSKSGILMAVLTLWTDDPGTFKEGKHEIYGTALRNLCDASFVVQSNSTRNTKK